MRRIVQRFKALSDETRLRILALLINGEMCVCDLMAILDLPQSTVSRHLAYLRNNGWVEDRRQGVWMYYRLFDDNEPFASDLRERMKRHLARWRVLSKIAATANHERASVRDENTKELIAIGASVGAHCRS